MRYVYLVCALIVVVAVVRIARDIDDVRDDIREVKTGLMRAVR